MMFSSARNGVIITAIFFLGSIIAVGCVNKASKVTPPVVTSTPAVEKTVGLPKQAWETEWDKTLEAARKERSVVIMGGFGAALAREPFIRAMKEKFGLDADITLGQVPVILQTIISQRRAGIYQNDIYLAGAISIVAEMFPRDLLQPIEPHLILPEVKDPKSWLGGEMPLWGPNREAFFSIMNIASFVAVNRNTVRPEEVTSYNDLLKPNLKGKIAMFDPTQPGAGRSFFTMSYRIMGPDYAKELLKQDLVLTRDLRQITEWVISSKYAVGIGMDSSPIIRAARDGFPVAMLPVFKEGAVVGAGGGQLTVFRDAPHPNAARVFVNWMLSKEGMTTLSKAVGMASRRVDVPIDHLDLAMRPSPSAKYVFETQAYIEEDLKLAAISNEIFGSLIGR